ncbi:MAG: GNAT family N-acetyltransferase [Solirubrobacteraceae bacterium]
MTPTVQPEVAGVASPEPVPETFELRDGRQLLVRSVRATDAPALQEFLSRLSLATRRLRFFTACCNLRDQAHRAAAPIGERHHGLVVVDAENRVVGHACYVRTDGVRAEVAVEVADDLHGLGLGTHLVVLLAHIRAPRHRAVLRRGAPRQPRDARGAPRRIRLDPAL